MLKSAYAGCVLCHCFYNWCLSWLIFMLPSSPSASQRNQKTFSWSALSLTTLQNQTKMVRKPTHHLMAHPEGKMPSLPQKNRRRRNPRRACYRHHRCGYFCFIWTLANFRLRSHYPFIASSYFSCHLRWALR